MTKKIPLTDIVRKQIVKINDEVLHKLDSLKNTETLIDATNQELVTQKTAEYFSFMHFLELKLDNLDCFISEPTLEELKKNAKKLRHKWTESCGGLIHAFYCSTKELKNYMQEVDKTNAKIFC